MFERDTEPGECPSLQELKLVKIEPFDGSEVYPGLGSNFYDWGKRFVRMVNMAQATSRKIWKESVKIERLSHGLNGKALSLFNARIDAWYLENPTLEHVLVKLNSRFTVVLQPAQMLTKFTQAKSHKSTWSEHLMYLIAVNNTAGGGYERLVLQNVVDYASPSLKTSIRARYDHTRTDYMQQAEELVEYAQHIEQIERKVNTVNSVDGRRNCYNCGKPGHLARECRKPKAPRSGDGSTPRNFVMMSMGEDTVRRRY